MRLGRGVSVLIGGARSGKSDLAVQLGTAWPGGVVFIATASADDDEMRSRIARHKESRTNEWALIESPMCSATDVEAADRSHLLILDCVTMLVANLMFAKSGDAEIDAHITMLADALARRSGPSIVVSNEVGLGVHPETKLGRVYRDVLGRSNRRLADRAESALFVSSGRVVPLEALEVRW